MDLNNEIKKMDMDTYPSQEYFEKILKSNQFYGARKELDDIINELKNLK